MTRAEFTSKTRYADWTRAGGPDDPHCECGCGQPITESDGPEYHHICEAESGATPERRTYLKSLDNCLCVRRSCHKRITRTETMPQIVRSRRQRMRAANIKPTPKRKMRGHRDDKWKQKVGGEWVLR